MASIVNTLLGRSKTTPVSSDLNTTTGTESQTSDTGAVGATVAETYAVIAGITPQIAVINLDLRGYFTPYNIPTLEGIIYAVQTLFKADEGLRLQQLRGAGTGIYRILLSKPIEDITNKFVVFKSGEGVINVPLEVPQTNRAGGQERRDGLLITFLNADAGTAVSIPGKYFDTAMEPFGEVIKCTQQQRYRNTSCLNSNRFCVIANEGKETVPSQISILNPQTQKKQKPSM